MYKRQTLPDIIRKIYGTGWRPVMLVYGAVGVLFAVLFWLSLIHISEPTRPY